MKVKAGCCGNSKHSQNLKLNLPVAYNKTLPPKLTFFNEFKLLDHISIVIKQREVSKLQHNSKDCYEK